MDKGILRRLPDYISGRKVWFVALCLCAVLSSMAALLLPLIAGRALDGIIGTGQVEFNLIWRYLRIFAAAAVAAAVFGWLMLHGTGILVAHTAQAIRRAAFAKIHSTPLAKIYSYAEGDIVSRLVADVETLSEGLRMSLTQLIPGVVTIAAAIGFMVSLHVGVAFFVIAATPLSIFFARFIAKRSIKYFGEQMDAQGDLAAHAAEMFPNRALIASLGYEAASADVFAKKTDRHFTATFRATFYSSIAMPGTRFVNALVFLGVATLGTILIIRGGGASGSLTVGGLAAFLAYAGQYTRPFNEVSATLPQMAAAIAAAKRVFEVIDWETEPVQDAEAATVIVSAQTEGHVVLRDISFSYEKTKPTLQNVSLIAEPGTHIALVGPTGSGKTTLINLLMRFFEPDSGEIEIDGVPIQAIPRGDLRRRFGMVLQDTWLPTASVRDIIAYGRPAAGLDEIIDAAKSAYAHHFITGLPQGYDTVLQDGGALSAGQRQLLGIARVFLTKPDMLLLDEATSAIDTRTEMLIQKALADLMKDRTSFIVAHRLSTTRQADCILVLDQGKIIERGKHAALLAQGGLYAKLYQHGQRD